MKKLFLNAALSFVASCALLAVVPVLSTDLLSALTDAHADSHSCSCKGEEDCTCEKDGCADEECAKHCEKCGEKKCSCGDKEHASSHEETGKTESCH
jgi:hypothetical protein